jgi:inositol hexakisphosphate/diphosphoinositol-pentakisphosphate kinase
LQVTKEIIRNYVEDYDPIAMPEKLKKLRQIRDVLECREISGINRKLQMKPQKWDDDDDDDKSDLNISNDAVKATELLLILKWGGDLTPLGCSEAEAVGMNFRHVMYPDNEGGGVLRLHATYRHDLKINSSDEGRVMKTAAAFAKGLLELDGELPPILASLVTVEEKTRQMLDRGGNCEIKQYMDRCKDNLNLLQQDEIMTDEKIELIAPSCSVAIKNAMISLKNPLKTLSRMYVLIGSLCSQLDILGREHGEDMDSMRKSSLSGDENDILKNNKSLNAVSCDLLKDDDIDLTNDNSIKEINLDDTNKVKLYLDETFSLMADRWEKIHKDFFSLKTNKYDLTKVPDVYDMVRFDILHNSHLKLDGINELFELSMAFENSVVPQEYGSDNNDKRIIGSKMCGALLDKIKHDLTVTQHHESEFSYNLDHSHAEDLLINSLGRCVRTRLYFTSESHLHTLLNVLRFPKEGEPCAISPEGLVQLDKISELGYLTQVMIFLNY